MLVDNDPTRLMPLDERGIRMADMKTLEEEAKDSTKMVGLMLLLNILFWAGLAYWLCS